MTNNHTTIEFLFYFDTNKKYIRDEDYISVLKSFSDISTLFCKDIFNIQNKIEVIVLPHEEGSFISKVGIFFLGAIVSGPISDASKGFLTGLIGKPLEVICQDYGVALKETIADFFKKEADELETIIPEEINMDKAINSKSGFYSTILSNSDIKAVNFNTLDKDTAIRREDFPSRITEDVERPLPDTIEFRTLQVYKPVLKQNNKGVWSFIDDNSGEIVRCTMDDPYFINAVYRGDLPLKMSEKIDVIFCRIRIERVMLNGEEKIVKQHITDVYSFNEKELKEIPPYETLKTYTPSTKSIRSHQLTFFD